VVCSPGRRPHAQSGTSGNEPSTTLCRTSWTSAPSSCADQAGSDQLGKKEVEMEEVEMEEVEVEVEKVEVEGYLNDVIRF